MIATLHIYALLVKARMGDVFLASARINIHNKIALLIRINDKLICLALVGPTSKAGKNLPYKKKCRPSEGDTQRLVAPLPLSRPNGPGYKRWYKREDFAFLLPDEMTRLSDDSIHGQSRN